MYAIANVTYVDFQKAAPTRTCTPTLVPAPRRSSPRPARLRPSEAPIEADVLVERMVLGDGVAADEMKRRYGRRLIATATEILGGDEMEATHVVDLVFEEASGGWPPPRGEVERWLKRLVRRAARHRARALGGLEE